MGVNKQQHMVLDGIGWFLWQCGVEGRIASRDRCGKECGELVTNAKQIAGLCCVSVSGTKETKRGQVPLWCEVLAWKRMVSCAEHTRLPQPG